MFELYKQGKSTHDIAKDLRMSLRDISIILRNTHASHGIPTTKEMAITITTKSRPMKKLFGPMNSTKERSL